MQTGDYAYRKFEALHLGRLLRSQENRHRTGLLHTQAWTVAYLPQVLIPEGRRLEELPHHSKCATRQVSMRMALRQKQLRASELAWSATELMELWTWSESFVTAESETVA
jgi:hypothetical protein